MLSILAPLLARAAPLGAFVRAHRNVIVFGVGVLAMLVAALVYGCQREKQGAAKTELRVLRQHEQTVREAVVDERLAQSITDTLGDRAVAQQVRQRAETDQTIKELTDAITSLPHVPAPERRAVLIGVRDKSNALVDRANRAADYAGPAD